MPPTPEVQLKVAEMRLKNMERAIEELRKEGHANDAGARLVKLDQRTSIIEKQLAILVANSFTKRDYDILEHKMTAREAEAEAAFHRREEEAVKANGEADAFQRKEIKRLETLFKQDMAKIEKIHLEQRLAVIEGDIKALKAELQR